MATRKQKHEAAVARREVRIAAEKAEGLAAQRRAHDRQEQARWEKERAENKKKAAAAIKLMAKAKEKSDASS